jgi:hypothetical protein
MAVSRASKSSIVTFNRYDSVAAGVTSGGAFAAIGNNTATRYVSADGITWTAYSLTNPTNTSLNICYYSTTIGGWYLANSGVNQAYYLTSSTQVAKMRSQTVLSWLGGATPGWQNGLTDTGRDVLLGSQGNGTIADIYGNRKFQSTTTGGYAGKPAYDGVTTWAMMLTNTNSVSSGRYSTGDSVAGDGLMPYEDQNVGKNGYASWVGFNLPATAQWNDIIYYKGYWYVITTGGAVYSTTNIATASPSWTSVGTFNYSNFQLVNNELWLIAYFTTTGTIYRLTTGGGTFDAISLPGSAKNCAWMAYGNGAYVIANTDGTVYRSTTGASGSFSTYSTGAAAFAGAKPCIAFGAA